MEKDKDLKQVTVAWECKECGHQHRWVWLFADANDRHPMHMQCEKCDDLSRVALGRIGARIFAGIW